MRWISNQSLDFFVFRPKKEIPSSKFSCNGIVFFFRACGANSLCKYVLVLYRKYVLQQVTAVVGGSSPYLGGKIVLDREFFRLIGDLSSRREESSPTPSHTKNNTDSKHRAIFEESNIHIACTRATVDRQMFQTRCCFGLIVNFLSLCLLSPEHNCAESTSVPKAKLRATSSTSGKSDFWRQRPICYLLTR